MPLPATDAEAFVPHLKKCGYADAQIARPFRIDTTDIDVVAFAGKPWDNWSACLAAVNLNGDSRESASRAKSLGVTSVFVCSPQGIDWWGLGPQGPTRSEPIRWADLGGFVLEKKHELAPRAIYDAKLRRPTAKPVQMTFFDVRLMPAVEKERGETLLRVVRSEIEAFEDQLGDHIKTEQDWEHVYRAVFWLLTAKVLNDKRVPNFINVDLMNVEDVFARIGKHHGVTKELPPFGPEGLAAIEKVAGRLLRRGSLADVSSESIAYLYEHALIDKAVHEGKTDPNAKPLSVRKRRGIHGTPSVLRDHMLAQLWPLIEDIRPADRRVLEPACGHAPFLTGMVRWLREWDEWGEPLKGHGFLRDRLVGLDNYAFARELAKLNLTLSDAEHKNSWTIKDGDMFAPGVLRRNSENAHILLSNPPYESFVKVKAERYLDTKEPVTAETQGVEMLKRTLPHLPPGGVFGVVMPVGVLHDKESKAVRKELLKDFDLSEVSVFADNLFEHGDHEVAVLMGRKKKSRSTPPRLMYRRVREAGMAAFKERLAFSWEREVLQGRFTQSEDADLRVRDLDELWNFLASYPSLSTVATVRQGVSLHTGRQRTVEGRDPRKRPQDAVPAIVARYREFDITELPTQTWLYQDRRDVLHWRGGTYFGQPQVLVNYASQARAAWRLKAFYDPKGHAVTNKYTTVRATDAGTNAFALWGLMNSPAANAFAHCGSLKRHTFDGLLKTMPIPVPTSPGWAAIEHAAARYRALAIAKAKSKPAPTDLFTRSAAPTGPIPTDADVRAALLAMDAAVLRAYDLPPRLERQLLDLFTGVERKGVGLDGPDGKSTFRGYYPPGFTSALPLHMVISEQFDRARSDKTVDRFKPGDSPHVRDVLHAIASCTEEL